MVAAHLPLAADPLGDGNATDGSGSAPAQPQRCRPNTGCETRAAQESAKRDGSEAAAWRPLRVPWSEGVQQSVRQAFIEMRTDVKSSGTARISLGRSRCVLLVLIASPVRFLSSKIARTKKPLSLPRTPLFALNFTSAMALWLGGKPVGYDGPERPKHMACTHDYQRNHQGYVDIIGAVGIACQEPANCHHEKPGPRVSRPTTWRER